MLSALQLKQTDNDSFAIRKLFKIRAGTNLFAMKLMNSKSVRSKLWLKFIFFTEVKINSVTHLQLFLQQNPGEFLRFQIDYCTKFQLKNHGSFHLQGHCWPAAMCYY
jgi:hypothetical protein